MKRIPRPLWQSRRSAAVAAAAVTCLAGCSSSPGPSGGANADPSIPADPAAARALMANLAHELATANADPEAAAFARERLRGRLIAAEIPATEVDDWSGTDRL